MSLQIARRQIKDSDEKIVRLQRVIDDLNMENDHIKDTLKSAEVRAQANANNLISQQQYAALEKQNKDQQKLLDFLKLKIENFNSKVAENEDTQASLRKTIEELQDNAISQRADFARLFRAENKFELEAEVQNFQNKLDDAKSYSDQQLLVVNTMIEELMDIEQMTSQQWFIQLPNALETDLDLVTIKEDLLRNKQRAEILVRCVPTNIASRLNPHSVLQQDSAKSRASQLMEPFKSEDVAQLASRVYTSLGQLRTHLDSHVRKVFAFSQDDTSKRQTRQDDAAVLNELKDVVDANVQHYQQQLQKQAQELDELRTQCRTYKNELEICQFGYDKSQARLSELQKELQQVQRDAAQLDGNLRTTPASKTEEVLAEQLSEVKAQVNNYQQKILDLKQKLENQKMEHERRITHINNKANEYRDQDYEKYKASLKETVEHVERRKQKQIDKLKAVIQHYESEENAAAFSNAPKSVSQKEQQLTKFINVLVLYSKNLRARIDREATVRADLAFLKRFFMMCIQKYKDGNVTQINLLRKMGIYVDPEAIRKEHDKDLAERERIKADLRKRDSYAKSIYNTYRPYSRAGNDREGGRRRYSRIERIEQIDDEEERNQQKNLYYRNVASGKRKIISAAQMFIAAIRLRNLAQEKAKFEKSYKQTKKMLREFVIPEQADFAASYRPQSTRDGNPRRHYRNQPFDRFEKPDQFDKYERRESDRKKNAQRLNYSSDNESERYSAKRFSNKSSASLPRSHSSFGPRSREAKARFY